MSERLGNRNGRPHGTGSARRDAYAALRSGDNVAEPEHAAIPEPGDASERDGSCGPRLLAISDLHLGHAPNREALSSVPAHPGDWLILAGDVGETLDHLALGLETLVPRFERLIWVPGNHELWSTPGDELRGEARYRELVALCRSYGVLTPEDPYPVWTGAGPPTVIAPLMLLYDYSFRPADVSLEDAVAWAREDGVLCADERYLHPDPYATRQAWCLARVASTEKRLAAVPDGHATVLVNHFPLRRDLVRLPRIPRFALWCGTRRTGDWHRRFAARVVVSGHLHVRTTRFVDGVRFEEVSLGYPRQWRRERGMQPYLREILPGHDAPAGDTHWR